MSLIIELSRKSIIDLFPCLTNIIDLFPSSLIIYSLLVFSLLVKLGFQMVLVQGRILINLAHVLKELEFMKKKFECSKYSGMLVLMCSFSLSLLFQIFLLFTSLFTRFKFLVTHNVHATTWN